MMFFGKTGRNMEVSSIFLTPKVVFLGYTFPMGYREPKMKIVCKSYDHGS
jgi:hypothetical protein